MRAFSMSGNTEYRRACCAGGCHWDTRLHLLCGRAQVSLGSVSCVRHLTAGFREGFHFLKNWLEHIGTRGSVGDCFFLQNMFWCIESVVLLASISRVHLRKAHVDHWDRLLWSKFSRAALCRGGLIGYVCAVYCDCGKKLKLKVYTVVGSTTATSIWSSTWSSRCFNFVALIYRTCLW